METSDLKADESQSAPSSLPLAELLDEAVGRQSESSEQATNERKATELEIRNTADTSTGHNALEMGHISENSANHEAENTSNMEEGLISLFWIV